MYAMWALGVTLIVLALLLVQYRPGVSGVEGFSVAAVDPTRMPACVERSTDAQKLLARFSEIPEEDAAASELRLLVSKLCCLEADIASPSAGLLRTMSLQFRTSHDMEPATSFVSRCLRNAVRDRDVDLVIDKFQTRGHELVHAVLGSGCGDAIKEFDAVVRNTRSSMMTFCFKPQPRMDVPAGVRDVAFYEPTNVANLDAYQGISASQ